MKTENIEIQTAKETIEKLSRHQVEDAALMALANEHEICRLAGRIEQFLDILARDYTAMAEMFRANGETTLYNLANELPELKAQLKCRKEARPLYANLLK
jgi:hypothetical protein